MSAHDENQVVVGGRIPPEDLEALTKIGIIGGRKFILLVAEPVDPAVPGADETIDVYLNLGPERFCEIVGDLAAVIRDRRRWSWKR